ncbi:hypothetical protein AB0I98_35695 [Streptomyces sp. NPDC050211]|uniref:hypothetical protein n=1 Tax=Streptomyces sp. NPDC050211 TaxID=3154932 RepID=UPI0034159AAE
MDLTPPHLAGWDAELRSALEDLQLDRWRCAKQLLRDTGYDWPLRTSRSQALAVGAAKCQAIEAWLAEEPDDWDALMMWARVLTQRVLNARRDGVSGQRLVRAVHAASAVCKTAADRWREDPVPFVCFVALAQVDTDPRSPHTWMNWASKRGDMLPPGPWELLEWVHQRDPYSREAYHRMLQVFQARGRGGMDFAQWAASVAPEGSALKVLPLYAAVEEYRRQTAQKRTVGTIAYWASEVRAYYAKQALTDWFDQTKPHMRSLLDLNHLAYVLTATGVGNAAEVFEAIGPYVTTAPWALVTENVHWWQDQFRSARNRALSERGRR